MERRDAPVGIVHSDEIEPVSGCGSPRCGSRPRGKDGAHVGGGTLALSHFHQGAYHGADHLFKEPVGIEGENDEISLAAQIRLLQTALRILVVGRRRFE